MEREVESRTKKWVIWCAAVFILIPAAYGFTEKFVQFVRTYRSEEDAGFTLFPISNYLFMTLGFLFLLVWATAGGMFRDIEKPKYTMLEKEAELDRLDGNEWTTPPAHPDRRD